MYCSKLENQAVIRSDASVVETKRGKIAGIKKDGRYQFRGIKYANARRFHMPEEVPPWEGVKPAVTYGYACPELTTPVPSDGFVDPHYYMPQDEDCQYLNIWTPTIEKDAGKPVMVWVHGGAWSFGSSLEQCAYDGEELSAFGDVVVVSFNHRHNCLGGLDLSLYGEEYAMSSCCGLGDVILLLKWVKENIHAFGGDSNNITVFGQSGGSAKILCAMQCPEADGLFQKAAIDSGGLREQIVPEGWTKKKLAQRFGTLTAEYLGMTGENIREIETVPYWDLADAAMKAEAKLKEEFGLSFSYRYEPVADGTYLVGDTLRDGFRSETKGIPMMIGNVFGESRSNMIAENVIGKGDRKIWSMEVLKGYCRERFGERADEILKEFQRVYPDDDPSDVLYMDYAEREGQINFVRQRAAMGADVWNWLFKKKSPILGGLTAWHCSELPFVFHNASYIESAFDPGVSEKLEDIMAGAWTAFAEYGDPNGKKQQENDSEADNIFAERDVPKWPKVSGKDIPAMVFDRVCETRVNHDFHLRALLKDACENRQNKKEMI